MRGPSHSGASLWIWPHCVVKTATGEAAARLAAQAVKQQKFETRLRNVRAARVDEINTTKAHTQILMERVAGPGIIVACPRWREHVSALVALVRASLDNAQLGRLPTDTVWRKLDDVVKRSVREHGDHPTITRAKTWLLSRITSVTPVPVGYCHGDLTLCNSLCDCATTPGGVALIDFLDTVFPSPLFDIAKLRQDTARHWISLFEPNVGVHQLEEADSLVVQEFSREAWWAEWYPVFDILNLLRLLPYARAPRVVSWIFWELERSLP